MSQTRKLTLQMLRDLFYSNFEILDDSLVIYELVEWDSYLPVLVLESWMTVLMLGKAVLTLSALYYLGCLGCSVMYIVIYIRCTAIHNACLQVP